MNDLCGQICTIKIQKMKCTHYVCKICIIEFLKLIKSYVQKLYYKFSKMYKPIKSSVQKLEYKFCYDNLNCYDILLTYFREITKQGRFVKLLNKAIV